MFDIKVTHEQYAYAEDQVNKYNFGRRGRGDGTKNEQFTGVLGQTVLADLLGLKRPDGSAGYDGGIDFIINQRTVDIKTMTRTVEMRNYFVHNFVGYQKKYPVEFYIFASFNAKSNIMTICGYIDKETFLKRAEYFSEGSIRKRADGTEFKTFAPLYEIKQTDLYRLNSKSDIENSII